MLDTATNLEYGLNVTYSQSGFRAFNPEIKNVFKFGQNCLAIESEMLAAAAGLRIKEVEIGVRYDDGSDGDNSA